MTTGESGEITACWRQSRKPNSNNSWASIPRHHCIKKTKKWHQYRKDIATWPCKHFRKPVSVNRVRHYKCILKLDGLLWAHFKWNDAKWKNVVWSDKFTFRFAFGKSWTWCPRPRGGQRAKGPIRTVRTQRDMTLSQLFWNVLQVNDYLHHKKQSIRLNILYLVFVVDSIK